MSSFRVLHLSDLHIGNTYINSEEIAHKIIGNLENNGLYSIKCVLVTGDIFEGKVKVEPKLIKEAITFFEIILDQINLIQEEHKLDKNDFIFVPGNHDVNRVEDNLTRWQKYNNFLEGFYGSIPDYYNKDNYTVVRPYHNAQIVFIGFNSCQLEKKVLFDEACLKNIKSIDSAKMEKLGLDKNNVIKLPRVRQSKAILGTWKNYESSNHAGFRGYPQVKNPKMRRHTKMWITPNKC